jgi:Uma2 family endonuclease
MATATAPVRSKADPTEQRFVLPGVGYNTYQTINDALGENPGVRLIYVDGRLTFLTASRRHEWFAERLAEFVKILARRSGMAWEDSGSATYRKHDQEVGVEGDKIFYLGEHAQQMRGAINIDLSTQPPPDLAIEVEVTHSADDALLVYGRIGVPEVWRFDVDASTVMFCVRNEQGTYDSLLRSRVLPFLEPADVLEQMLRADSLGASLWNDHLEGWVVETILPRLTEG